MNYDEPTFTERLADAFNEGGSYMYPIAALGCLLAVLSVAFLVVAMVSRAHTLTLALVLLGGAIAPVSLGVLAEAFAMTTAEVAIAHAHPDDREAIRIGSLGEALNLRIWGLGGSVLPTLVGLTLLGLGLSRLERFQRPA